MSLTAFRPRLFAAAATAALVGCSLGPAPAAEATYPGRNGTIAFQTLKTVEGFVLPRTEAIRPDGTGRHELADFAFPSWSASGRRLFGIDYALDYRSGELPRLVFADGSGRLRGEVPLPETLPCGWVNCASYEPALVPRMLVGAPAPSPDGRMVAFVQQVMSHLDAVSTGTNIPSIWTVRTDGSDLRRLVRGDRPHWTPDGRRIVFQRIGPYGQHNSVASMQPDGTAFRRVHVSSGDDRFLDLSPDAHRVLWWGNIRRRGGPEYGLYTSRVNGGDFRLVHSALERYNALARVNAASWSPDGTKIVFSEQQGSGTFIVPATGGRPRRLLARPHDELAWQPLPAAQTR